jgi:uncharacterized protein YjdB
MLCLSLSSFATIGPILGSSVICSGTGVYLSDTSAGGVWTTSNPAVLIAGSSSGIVAGVAAGTAIVTYTTSSGFVTASITVNPSPATITGMTSVCAGYASALTDATAGGIWSSSATSIATVDPTGSVTGVSGGLATITYAVGGCYATTSFTVIGGSIGSLGVLGCNTVGVGDTMPFGSPGPGVSYYTSDPSIIKYSFYPSAGIVGVSPGVANINVFGSTGCLLGSVPVTVTPTQMVYPPTGRYQVCAGDTAQMHDIIPGGVWSTSPTSAATINSSGLLNAISQWPVWLTYTVAGGLHCTTEVDVISLPTISGPSSVCVGDTIYLSGSVSTWWYDVVLGGIYTDEDTSIAKSIWASNFDGSLKGMSPGVDTITYTDVQGPRCSVSKIITVNAMPSVGPISGATTFCIGTPVALSDTAAGGVWSSGNVATATAGSTGLISGISAGSADISYSVTNSCGVAVAMTTVTVSGLPAMTSIAGASSLCVSSFVSLSDSTTGGMWSSSTVSIGTVGSTGIVNGISSGIDTIMYTVINSCGPSVATVIVTVNPLPDAGTLTGTEELCIASIIVITDMITGGTWSSDMAGIAAVGSVGEVTGVSAGTATISYSVSNVCGTAVTSVIVTVDPVPTVGSISGTATVCALSSVTLTDSTAGGVWSSSGTSVATVAADGVVTGVSAGTDTVMYTITEFCGAAVASTVVTVNPLPDAGSITGTGTVCEWSTTELTDTTTGGTWS